MRSHAIMNLTKVPKVAAAASVLMALMLISLVVTTYWYFATNPEDQLTSATVDATPSTRTEFGFTLLEKARQIPEIRFVDGEGRTLTLADFRGRLVLLNIWATWCVPCRREMPTLDRLQAKLGGPDFEVLALSIDKKGVPVVKAFYKELGLKSLRVYVDAPKTASRDLNVVGLPTTLLVNRKGDELGRLVGSAEWDSPEIISFLREQSAKGNSPLTSTIYQSTNNQTQESNK